MHRLLISVAIVLGLSACQTTATLQQAASQLDGALGAAVRSSEPGLASSDKRTAITAFVEACIVEFRDPVRGFLPRLRASGWTAVEFGGTTEYEVYSEKAGISGFVASFENRGFCAVGETATLNGAKRLVDSVIQRRFAQIAQRGRMEGRAGPCDGWVLFPGRGTITIAYDGQGNDPFCPDPNGTNIRITGSTS